MRRVRCWNVMPAFLMLLPLSVLGQTETAQNSDQSDVTVVVTAERTLQPVSESISSATVVTAKQIKERGAQTVADVLRMVPGVSIQQSGQTGAVATAHLRGASMTQVLVLVDGRRVTSSAFSGSADLSKFPVDDIARVEVIRGPASSLYGSEAIGGVINIITKRPNGRSGDVTLGFGGNGRQQRAISMKSGDDRVAWQINGTLPQYSGERPNSDYSATDLSSRVVFNDVRGWELTASGNTYHDSLGLPGTISWQTPEDRQWWYRNSFDLAGKRDLWGGNLDCRVYNMSQKLEEKNPDPMFPVDSRITGVTNSGEFVFNRSFGAHQWVLGSEVRHESYDDVEKLVSLHQHQSIDNRALFAQDRLPLGPGTDAVIGLRLDDHSVSGSSVTPRLGVTRSMGKDTRVRASYAGGFRAPSMVELYYNNYGTTGNPNLRPEKSRQIELGLNTTVGSDTLDIALFSNRVKDLITWVIDNPELFTSTFINVGRARQRGIEVAWGHRLGEATNLDLSYTYTDAVNLDTHQAISGVPHNQLTAAISSKVRSYDIALTGRVLSQRPFGSASAGGFTTYDLTITKRGNARTNPYLLIRNILDKQYQEVAGYPAEGRSFELGMRSSW